MPHTSSHVERRSVILELIGDQRIEKQSQLLEELRRMDFEVGQSSISRDLEALGVVKIDGRYRIIRKTGDRSFEKIKDFVLGFKTAGRSLIVVRTVPGGAQRVAHTIDSSGWPEVVGTVAGDDTLFIATESATSQDVLLKRLEAQLN